LERDVSWVNFASIGKATDYFYNGFVASCSLARSDW
jgi:hypothetical protein